MPTKKKKPPKCRESGCWDPPYLGGLCKAHHEVKRTEEERREAAINLLHTFLLDKREIGDAEARAELVELSTRWSNVCSVLIGERGVKDMPLDEAQYAQEWCITLAQELVDTERAVREGKPRPARHYREILWERFHNLEAGLMSNGLPRRG